MISILITFTGFIIAVSLFLYFLNTLDAAKQGIKKLTDCNVELENTTGSAALNSRRSVSDLTPEEKKFMPGRKCPLCSKTLTRDEPLYGTYIEASGTKKILIHGCPYCYKDTDKTV